MKTIINIAFILLFISCNTLKPEDRVLITSENDAVLVLNVPKAGCQNCQKVVEGGLLNEKGVKQSILNLHTKEVSIVYTPGITNADDLHKKVSKLITEIPCK